MRKSAGRGDGDADDILQLMLSRAIWTRTGQQHWDIIEV